MDDYFQKELSIPVFHDNQEYTFSDKTFLIGHGDGKGPGDEGYKRMKKVFTNPFFKWLFRWLHPDIGVRIAQYLSVKNKLISGDEDITFLGEDNEWLILYSKRKLETKHWGQREFSILDPDNNLLTFGQSIQRLIYSVNLWQFSIKISATDS